MERADFTVYEGGSMDKKQALEQALAQIDKTFGKGSIMRLGANDKSYDIEAISTGSLGLDIALGIGGLPKGRVVEIYGPEFVGQDDVDAASHRRSPEEGRHLRVHRRRTRARSGLCPQARREGRRPADLAARYRRAGARNRRYVGSLRRRRCAGYRQRRGVDAESRTRRRHGRFASRPAGPFDEPSAAQADGFDLEVGHDGHFHQPNPHENRRDVRQSRRPRRAAMR